MLSCESIKNNFVYLNQRCCIRTGIVSHKIFHKSCTEHKTINLSGHNRWVEHLKLDSRNAKMLHCIGASEYQPNLYIYILDVIFAQGSSPLLVDCHQGKCGPSLLSLKSASVCAQSTAPQKKTFENQSNLVIWATVSFELEGNETTTFALISVRFSKKLVPDFRF